MHPVLSDAAGELSVATTFPKVDVMGVRFGNLSQREAVEHMVSSLESGRGGVVVTPNVDIMRKIHRDPDLARIVGEAGLVIPDGMPAVWASRLQGTPLKERFAFCEMIYPLARAAASKGKTFALLGGEPGVAERAADTLRLHAPGIDIVATYAPPLGFEHDENEMYVVVELLARAKPDIVVCSFGCPKQERLMARLAPKFPTTWFVGAGGTLTILSGRTSHAPAWMRRSGLTWLHRLRLEPRRLFRRYVIEDAPFAIRMLTTSAMKRRSGAL